MLFRNVAMLCLSLILLAMVAPSLQRSSFDLQARDISGTKAGMGEVSILRVDEENGTLQTSSWSSTFCHDGYACGCCYGTDSKSAPENQYHCFALKDPSNCCDCSS
ncbi:hypothetical protein Mapa_012927 [Marchantia paleacea]|nr:hypothetical protein Mapa_012927 [Marchantia paleacea]